MDTSNKNIKTVKDNWDDSSESEHEYENCIDVNNHLIDPFDELPSKSDDENEKDNDIEGEWDFYDGYTACINCGISSNQRIIMIESKRVFCYDACLENNINDDDDDYDDDYDELGEYDKKLGLSVSCR
jgi:hypothetical protein